MRTSKILLALVTLAGFGAVILFFSRTKIAPRSPQVESEKMVPSVLPPAPPRPEEVQAKLQKIFHGAVTPVSERVPYFFAGDFNGDGLQDLAVFVKPEPEELAGLNSQFANWILEDPFAQPKIKPNQGLMKTASQHEAVKAVPKDVLLVIVHGYGPEAWRDPMAQQTFVLRNAAGEGARPEHFSENLLRPQQRLLMTGPNVDVIRETLAGHSGFLYWNGARYAWHYRR